LLLRPYRLGEDGKPQWLLTQLEFRHGSSRPIATTLSVTRDDLRQLHASLSDVVSGRRSSVTIVTLDDDFILEVAADEAWGTASVGFWEGEPALLMRGYRFTVPLSHIRDFLLELAADERAVTARAAPP